MKSHIVLTRNQVAVLRALYQRHEGGDPSPALLYPNEDSGMSAALAYNQLVTMGFCRTVTSESGKRRCHLTESGLEVCRQTFPAPTPLP